MPNPVTLLIALVGSIGIWVTTPRKALAVYMAVLLLYPQYIVLYIGSVSLSATRILGFVLMAKMLRRGSFNHFNWNRMDTFVLAAYLGKTSATIFTTDLLKLIERRGGLLLDTIIPYFCVRLILTSMDDILAMLKSLSSLAIPLAGIGVYQSITGQDPYLFLLLGQEMPYVPEIRQGFYRAVGPLGNPINFGLVMSGLFPLCLGMTGFRKTQKNWVQSGWLYALIGAVSSMSSAAFFSIAVSTGWILFYRFRRSWLVILLVSLAAIFSVEMISNRHFYQVFDRVALNPKTARYRVGLTEEAFGGGMKGHWLVGYGLVGIGEEEGANEDFDWEHQDLVNIYIGILATTGLLGLLPYLCLNILYYKWLFQLFAAASSFSTKWLVWCFLGALFGWNVAMLTVGAFGVNTHLHVFFGIISNLKLISMQNMVSAKRFSHPDARNKLG